MKRILFLLLFLPFSGKSQTITTIAGDNLRTYTGDGGPATAASIGLPIGIVIDTAGNIYFSADEINIIRKIDPAGIITPFAGIAAGGYSGDGGPASVAKFSSPQGLCFDKYGNMYVVDGDNTVVRKINTAGIVSTIAGNGTAGFKGDNGPATNAEFENPVDVKVDTAGNVYISDFGNANIRKVDKSGIITTIAGNGTSGYTGDGGPATAAELNWPAGLAFDSLGNLYFADYSNDVIRMIKNDTVYTVVGTTPGGFSGDGGPATAAQLWGPWGIAFDKSWNLFIVETFNNRIREVTAAGIVHTVAGNGYGSTTWSGAYAGDGGPATNAELYWPAFVATGAAGSFYITDESNKVIRKVDTVHPKSSLDVQQVANNTNNFLILPDPNNGTFTIKGSLSTINDQQVSIEARNMIGQTVYQSQVFAQRGTINTLIVLNENLPPGMYVLNIKSAAENHVLSFIKNN